MIILKVFVLIGFSYLVKSKTAFMSNLPLVIIFYNILLKYNLYFLRLLMIINIYL